MLTWPLPPESQYLQLISFNELVQTATADYTKIQSAVFVHLIKDAFGFSSCFPTLAL